jgi:uncharacterized protein YkwD
MALSPEADGTAHRNGGPLGPLTAAGSRATVRAVRRVAALAVIVLAMAGPAYAAPSTLDQSVLADINAFRVAHHLAPLRLSPALTTAARSHTLQMEADGYFAHTSVDGTAFWKRIAGFYPSTGYASWSVGENLLWSSPDVTAANALHMWVDSPEHLRNLLDPSWREIGVSAVHAADAPGVFHGLPVTIVTTDFGTRRG